MAAERPGMHPMTTPIVTPMIIMSRFMGCRALPKPAAIRDKVCASINPPYKKSSKSMPFGSGTFRNVSKVPKIRPAITTRIRTM